MIVACVRTGNKYGPNYVYKLRDMVKRNLPIDHEFICLTENPNHVYGVKVEDIWCYHLPGWWGKMALFEPYWRKDRRVVYIDLDMVICGDLTPLANLEIEFGICGNFTRAAGNKNWPCIYGSCVMTIGENKCSEIWERFSRNKTELILRAGNYGDQKVIEELKPDATILQEVLPAGYFLGYRNLTDNKPSSCSVVAFAGNSKPDNCNHDWIKKEWK